MSWFVIWQAVVALAALAGSLVMSADPGLACRSLAVYKATSYAEVQRHHPACPPI